MDWLSEDKEILISKIGHLKNYFEELKSFETIGFHEYQQDKTRRRAIERLLQLVVEMKLCTKMFLSLSSFTENI